MEGTMTYRKEYNTKSYHLRIKSFPRVGGLTTHNIKHISWPACIIQTYIICGPVIIISENTKKRRKIRTQAI